MQVYAIRSCIYIIIIVYVVNVVITLILYFSRAITTQPGDDLMPGLVPEGTKCGTNMVKLFCLLHEANYVYKARLAIVVYI